jgi:glutamyl-tRNA reductase
MNIVLVGLDHKTTPLELREKLAFQPKRLAEALSQLTQSNGTTSGELFEAVILSTCNRVEIYAVVKDEVAGKNKIISFLSNFHGVPTEEFEPHLSFSSNLAVAAHLFSVVSGIDSMVIGENQIQRQVKQAFESAQQFGTTGPLLSTLFQNALAVGKRGRRETEIGKNALSISGAAVNLVQRFCPQISTAKILVIGVGEMGLVAVKNLFNLGARDITLINRTEERLQTIANEFDVRTYGFDRLEECLGETDVVLSCTGAPHTVLSKETVGQIQESRSERPLLIVDIAVPRDVDPEVAKLETVQLYNIDELKTRIEVNLEKRCGEIDRVRDIINEELGHFSAWLQSLKAKPVIKKLRKKAEDIREQEFQRALRRLDVHLSEDEVQVVNDLSRRIVNKILHQPLTRLREEASAGNGDLYTATVQDLFDLAASPQKK